MVELALFSKPKTQGWVLSSGAGIGPNSTPGKVLHEVFRDIQIQGDPWLRASARLASRENLGQHLPSGQCFPSPRLQAGESQELPRTG